MKSPITNVTNPKQRIWLKRIVITLAIIVMVPLGLFTIGWLNRDTVIDVFQEWYKENNTGTLSIGKVNANFLSDFPKVSFTLKDIKQTDFDSISHQFSTLQIDNAKLVISAGNLVRGNMKFEQILIKNAQIFSEVKANQPRSYYEQLKRDQLQSQRKGFRLPEWLDDDNINLQVENVQYITKDSLLNKYFNLDFHKLKANFKKNSNSNLVGNVSMDITVNNLGFNTSRGSFFNGARVKGSPKFNINLNKNTIQVPEFLLKIGDDQAFNVVADFDLSKENTYVFKLQNSRTNFKTIKTLLPDSLAVKLQNYSIQKPIQTSLYLAGKFAYGNNPDIKAEFSTSNNTITIAANLNLKNASFSGRLSNDIYETDSLRTAKRTRKDIKITFDSLNADLDDIKLNITNAKFHSTPEAKNFVDATLNLEGRNETLATLIDMDNFNFRGGSFQLNATIFGDIPNPYQFLNKTTGNFNLNDTNVILKKNGLQLPIESIEVTLNRNKSVLRHLIISLPNDDNLVLHGELNNISGILSTDPKIPTTSKIFLDSETLNLNDVIALATSFIPKSEREVNDRKTLHETLDAVYSQFHPQFKINIGTLQYKEVIINDLRSDMELVNSESIRLQNFEFKYLDATTSINGSIRVPEPESNLKDAIYINAKAKSSGSINIFKELFDITLFRFDSGNFNFFGSIDGNVKDITELLSYAKGDLTLTNTKLHYEPALMDIKIDSLGLIVDNSDILLNKFNVEIDDVHTLKLNGSIKQFPSFLLNNSQETGSVFLKLTAPFIDADTLLASVNSLKDEEKSQKPKNKRDLHALFKDINRFNPEIELAIDSLRYDGLTTENIKALLFFENDSILKLNNLDLTYKETVAKIKGRINTHVLNDSFNENPFDLDFNVEVKGRSEDLNAYLKTNNFIFKSGKFEFTGNYQAQSKDLNILNPKTFGELKIGNTLVDYRAANLLIPIDSLHIKIEDDLATLETLDIALPNKSSIEFSGFIENFSNFIKGSNDLDGFRSDISIYAPYLDTSDLKQFLETTAVNKQKREHTDVNLQKWKDALVKINSSFSPTLDIKIDTLRHKDLDLTKFGLAVLFDQQGNFKLNDTQLDFYGGSIELNMDVGLNTDLNTPVDIDMRAESVNLQELVKRFDFFNDEALRNAEKIAGTLHFNIKAKGNLLNNGELNTDSLNGTIQFTVNDLELFNYKPIMDNSILMSDERFRNLRFRPIVQTFKIEDGVIIIPQTEIQSSAIQVFIEGQLKLNDYIDIWLSIPYKNLKRNDGIALPEKTTFDKAGAKFYLQLKQMDSKSEESKEKLKVKFRLSNRKMKVIP